MYECNILVRVSDERCSNNCGCQLLKLSVSASQGALGVNSSEIACPACSGLWEILQSTPLARARRVAPTIPSRNTEPTTTRPQVNTNAPTYSGGDHYGNAIKGRFIRDNTDGDEITSNKMCKCGLAVVLRTVVKAGPNNGKKYFSCSKNRYFIIAK